MSIKRVPSVSIKRRISGAHACLRCSCGFVEARAELHTVEPGRFPDDCVKGMKSRGGSQKVAYSFPVKTQQTSKGSKIREECGSGISSTCINTCHGIQKRVRWPIRGRKL